MSIGRAIFRSALGGYGGAIGRDAWRATKKYKWLLLFLVIVAGFVYLPFIGGRGMTQAGHERGLFGGFFKTFLANFLLIVAGFLLSFFVTIPIFMLLIPAAAGREGEALFGLLAWSFLLTELCALAGMITGAIQNPERVMDVIVRRHNEKFLDEHGIQDTGGEDVTHYDADQTPLRYIESQVDREVFMVVGKRKRAYIMCDEEGAYLEYTGPV